MATQIQQLRKVITTVDLPLIRIVNLFGLLYIFTWIIGITLAIIGGYFNNQFMIYYIIPLLLAYYSFYIRIKANGKLEQAKNRAKKVASNLKISEAEALEYTKAEIENELFKRWLSFNILVFLVIGIVIAMFMI